MPINQEEKTLIEDALSKAWVEGYREGFIVGGNLARYELRIDKSLNSVAIGEALFSKLDKLLTRKVKK
jgi:hypothetical protein